MFVLLQLQLHETYTVDIVWIVWLDNQWRSSLVDGDEQQHRPRL